MMIVLICFNTKENIDQIFSKCDLALNVLHNIENQCPIPNTNLGIMDWLEYLWLE